MADEIEIRTRPDGNVPSGGDNWKKKLGEWVYQLSVLKVVTYVGDAEVVLDDGEGGNGLPKAVKVPKAGVAFVTVCDLVGGDMTNCLPTSYGDHATVEAFHQEQVEKAAKILPNNLRLIGGLIDDKLLS